MCRPTFGYDSDWSATTPRVVSGRRITSNSRGPGQDSRVRHVAGLVLDWQPLCACGMRASSHVATTGHPFTPSEGTL